MTHQQANLANAITRKGKARYLPDNSVLFFEFVTDDEAGVILTDWHGKATYATWDEVAEA
jgi:hypothetical protein